MNHTKFMTYLSTGIYVPTMDADETPPPNGNGGLPNQVDLQKHDAKYHPNGYKEGDSCKYREQLAKGDLSDAALASAESAEKKALHVQKLSGLKGKAKLVGEAFAAMAKHFGKDPVELVGLEVEPSERWNPDTNEMELTGDVRISSGFKGSFDKANALLDAVAKTLGIKRKPDDVFDGGEACRISTFATPEEIEAVKGNLVKMKEAALKKAEQAKADAEEKAKSDKAKSILGMAAHAIAAAAKSVNFHVAQGDFAPNPTKVHGAMAAQKDIEAIAEGLTGEDKATADKLLKACAEIEESVFKGKHGKVSKVDVPEQVAKPQPKPAEPPKAKESEDKGGKLPADIGAIRNGLVEGAKTINYHIQAGDFKPNMSRIAQFAEAAKKLHELCPDGTSDNPYLKHLCARAAEIAKSMKNGFKDKIGMIDEIPAGAVSKTASKPSAPQQKPTAGEAADAYDYDPNRWAHMAAKDIGPDGMRDAADAMSVEEATAYLKKLGIDAIHEPTKFVAMHKPVKDTKVFADSVTCAAASIKDLLARFPNLAKCHLAHVFPSIPKSFGTAAEWVKDYSDPDNSVIAFHADYDHIPSGLGYSYSHQDSRYPFDVFRHEYMHGISTGAVAKKWKAFVADNYGYPAKGFFKLMKDKVSGYAASGDIYEAQAEIFAKMTSHDYKPGTLPRKIEDFFYGEVMGAEPAAAAHMMYSPEQIKSMKSGGKESQKHETPKATQTAPASADEILSWFSSPQEKVAAPASAQTQKVHAPALAFA